LANARHPESSLIRAYVNVAALRGWPSFDQNAWMSPRKLLPGRLLDSHVSAPQPDNRRCRIVPRMRNRTWAQLNFSSCYASTVLLVVLAVATAPLTAVWSDKWGVP